MKFVFAFLFSVHITGTAFSQSVSVSAVAEHSGFSQSQFPLASGHIEVSPDQLTIGSTDVFRPAAWAISPKGNRVGVVKAEAALNYMQLGSTGSRLTQTELEFFDTTDRTLAVFQFDDGRAIVRDNVANFTFFDAGGKILYSVSNSTQSPEGERISLLAADPSGKTVVLYNPVISLGGGATGSRARLVFGEDDHDIFFRSDSREIEQLRVSADGSYITMLTKSGSSQRAHIFDRFGNELFTMDPDDTQLGISLSGRGEYLTTYSRGRVQVYNMITGERVGSTSSRNPVLYATFIPQDESIIAFGGNLNNGTISNPTVTVIHVGRRQIAREDLNMNLAAIDLNQLEIEREGANRFLLKGLNRNLRIQSSF
jgi:hypothetical protein